MNGKSGIRVPVGTAFSRQRVRFYNARVAETLCVTGSRTWVVVPERRQVQAQRPLPNARRMAILCANPLVHACHSVSRGIRFRVNEQTSAATKPGVRDRKPRGQRPNRARNPGQRLSHVHSQGRPRNRVCNQEQNLQTRRNPSRAALQRRSSSGARSSQGNVSRGCR